MTGARSGQDFIDYVTEMGGIALAIDQGVCLDQYDLTPEMISAWRGIGGAYEVLDVMYDMFLTAASAAGLDVSEIRSGGDSDNDGR